MKSFLILFLSFIIVEASWKTERENLDYVYKLGDFRVFYTMSGKNALSKENKLDLNNNKVPDYVENITQRLKVSKDVFTELLGFQDPLKSKRYKDVKYIDIHILKSKYSSSGDGIFTFNYKILKTKDKVLSMKIRNDLDKDTMTPSHEYFHLLQNSYSMFKNRWYTEGTARWSERVFKKGTGRRESLPQSMNELKIMLKKSYKTKGFWRKLAYICDTNNGHFNNNAKYETNIISYPNLIEDNRIYGYSFMKRFFEDLDYQDNLASIKRGFDEFNWSEDEQKYNTSNNKYILRALSTTINNSCIRSNNQELIGFMKILTKYTNE